MKREMIKLGQDYSVISGKSCPLFKIICLYHISWEICLLCVQICFRRVSGNSVLSLQLREKMELRCITKQCIEFGGVKPGKHGCSIRFIALKSRIKQKTGVLQGQALEMSKSATVGYSPSSALGLRDTGAI